MLSHDSLPQNYTSDVVSVHGANGQLGASTIRQNGDTPTTFERDIGEVERFALIDALTRAEGLCSVSLSMDGRGASAVVTANFRLPLGGVNLIDAATLAALVDAVEINERPAAPRLRPCPEHAAVRTPTTQRSIDLNKLSARELLVFRTLAGGRTNQQIARELNLSVDTVKIHMRAIFRKIGASNRAQACVLASQFLLEA